MQCCMLPTRGIYGIILNKEGGVILSELKFIVYDVQHGSCSHVITPANQHIIIDLGSKAETSNSLMFLLTRIETRITIGD